jgi:hypothetical protein
MFSTALPALASDDVSPGLLYVLFRNLEALPGPAFVVILIGAALGYGAAVVIDQLPAVVGILLGILAAFFILSLV